MVDPVMLLCGHSFERSGLEQWYHFGKRPLGTCAHRCEYLGPSYTPNIALRNTIEALCAKSPEHSRVWQQRHDLELAGRLLCDASAPAEHNGGLAPMHLRVAMQMVDSGVKLYYLGQYYEAGAGGAVNLAKAAELYAQAAKVFQQGTDAGDMQCAYRLAMCYSEGRGVAKSCATVMKLLHAASAEGHADATSELELFYLAGLDNLDTNPEKAVELFENAAAKGCAEAIYNLGVCRMGGKGAPRNPEEGAALLQRAVDMGHVSAKVVLAVCYEIGDGVAKDTLRGRELLQQAAAEGGGVPRVLQHLAACCNDDDAQVDG